MKNWETQLLKHILNEKFLQEDEKPELQKEDKKSFLQAVANYHRLGEIVYAKRGLKEVAKTVQNIVEKAEALTMQESEHWFDNVTVSRHMKQLKEAHKVFEKTSTEMSGLQQRLEAAYDDMGSILGRYYKVGTALNEDDDEITESTVNEAKRSKFLLYTNPGNSTNSAYIAIGAEDVREVQRDARTYRDSYKILYQGTGTQEDLEKATKRFSNYSFGRASIDESLNEGVKKYKGREVYPEWIDPKRDFGSPIKSLKNLQQGAEYILWEPGMDCWQAEFIYKGKKGGMHTFTSTTQMNDIEPMSFNEPDLLDYIKSGDIIKQN